MISVLVPPGTRKHRSRRAWTGCWLRTTRTSRSLSSTTTRPTAPPPPCSPAATRVSASHPGRRCRTAGRARTGRVINSRPRRTATCCASSTPTAMLSPDALSRAVASFSDSDLGLVSMLLRTDTGTASEAVLMPIVNYGLLALARRARREARLPQGGDRPRAVRHGHAGCVHRGRGARRRACAHRRRRAARPVGEGLRTPRRAPQRHRPRPHPVVHRLSGDLERLLEERVRRDRLPARIALLTLFVVVPALLIPFLRLGAGLTTGGTLAFPAAQVGLILSMRAVTSHVGRDPMWSVPLHPIAIAVWAGTFAGRWCSPTPGARSSGKAAAT